MNGIERIEAPGRRRRDHMIVFGGWVATEAILVMLATRRAEPPASAEELALGLTAVTLAAVGVLGSWQGWRGVRPLVPLLTLVATANRVLTGMRGLVFHEQKYHHGIEVTEVAVPVVMVAGTLFVGLAAWYAIRRDPA